MDTLTYPQLVELATSHDVNKGIIITDNLGKILFCNDKWLNLCGFSRDEAIGSTNKILQGPLTEESKKLEIENSIKAKVPINIDITNYKKDKTLFNNNLTINPVSCGFYAEIQDAGISNYEVAYNRAFNKRTSICT